MRWHTLSHCPNACHIVTTAADDSRGADPGPSASGSLFFSSYHRNLETRKKEVVWLDFGNEYIFLEDAFTDGVISTECDLGGSH